MEHPTFIIVNDEELEEFSNNEFNEQDLDNQYAKISICDIINLSLLVVILICLLPLIMAILNNIEYGYPFLQTFVLYLFLEIMIFICSIGLFMCMD